MPQFGTLLKSLATKAGLKLEDETLKKILAVSEVSTLEVPEEFNNALEQNLLTVESASANTTVRSKLFAEALNGVDKELDRVVGDFEFDDAFKGEYKGIEKNTMEKVRKLSGGLKSKLEAAKKKAAESGTQKDQKEVEVLTKQIEELNRATEQLKVVHKTEIENLKAANLNDRKEFTMRSLLAGKPLPKNGLSADINILTAKTLIEQAMAKDSLQVMFDEAGQPLLKQRKDGTDIDFFVDNKKVDYSTFIDGVLAQNKFIQVNDPNPTPGPGNNPPTPPGNPTNAGIVSEIDAQMASLGITV